MSEQFNENEPKDMMGNGRGENHNSRKMNRKRNVAGIVASALLFGCVAGGSMAGINAAASHLWNINQTTAGAAVAGTQAASQTAQSSTAQNNNSGTVTLAKSNAADKKSVSQIVKDAMPSVVSITNMVQYRQNGFSIFGDQGETGTAAASGSGIIVGKTDDELLIATNNHVVSDSTSLSVQFADGESVDAKIKGTDADADLAVIAVDLKNMKSSTLDKIKVAEFGDSDEAQIGDQVVAIGNALGYGQSVTTGIISAKDRDIESDKGTEKGLLQTDAAINPGNSGGALLNMEGKVIGINVAKYSSTDVEGMGYSIPSAKAKSIINTLASKQTRSTVDDAERGYLGIQAKTVDAETAKAFDMPAGVFVYKITENSSAAKSDLQEKDIITKFDGQGVDSLDDLQALLKKYKAGETITLTVQRIEANGKYVEKEIQVTLGKNPDAGKSKNQNDNGSGSVFGRGSQDGNSDEDSQQQQLQDAFEKWIMGFQQN